MDMRLNQKDLKSDERAAMKKRAQDLKAEVRAKKTGGRG
jgi:hypothetical protein